MLVSIGFLVLMILIGGVVAYIADNLGRTLGKKRLTLFHLRPRHSATVMTVAAGMLIPLITVIFLAAVSKEFRQWITEANQALQQRDDAYRQRDQARESVGELQRQQRDLVVQNTQVKTENERYKGDLRITMQKVEQQKVALKSFESRVQQSAIQVLRLTNELRLLNSQKDAALKEKNVALKSRDQILASLKVVKDSYYSLKNQYDELNRQYNTLSVQIDQLQKQNTSLGSENADLTQKNADARLALQEIKRELESSKLTLDQAKADLAIVVQQRDVIGQQRDVYSAALANDYTVSRFKPLSFMIGEELARVSIPAGTSAEQAKGLVANLLRQAVTVALNRGARPPRDNPRQDQPPADPNLPAGLFSRRDETGSTLTYKEVEGKIVRGATGNKDDLILVASSFANSFQGEWVPLDVKPYRNPLVYHSGDKIAEGRIASVNSDYVVYQQVFDFLHNTVRPKALQDNMIPVAGREEQFGEVSSDEIFDLVKKIRDTGRPVRLVAVASADTHAGDPLRLHFSVR